MQLKLKITYCGEYKNNKPTFFQAASGHITLAFRVNTWRDKELPSVDDDVWVFVDDETYEVKHSTFVVDHKELEELTECVFCKGSGKKGMHTCYDCKGSGKRKNGFKTLLKTTRYVEYRQDCIPQWKKDLSI